MLFLFQLSSCRGPIFPIELAEFEAAEPMGIIATVIRQGVIETARKKVTLMVFDLKFSQTKIIWMTT